MVYYNVLETLLTFEMDNFFLKKIF